VNCWNPSSSAHQPFGGTLKIRPSDFWALCKTSSEHAEVEGISSEAVWEHTERSETRWSSPERMKHPRARGS